MNDLKTDKYVALLFDDGPHEVNGIRICEIAAAESIHVSFAQVGKNIAKHPELTLSAKEAGHEIINHSMEHLRVDSLEGEDLRNELLRPVPLIEAVIGVKPRFYWPPYMILKESMLSFIADGGMELLEWRKFKFVDSHDWNLKDYSSKDIFEASTAEMIPAESKEGELRLVLFHEWRNETVALLPSIIGAYKKAGYHFVTVEVLNDLSRLKAS